MSDPTSMYRAQEFQRRMIREAERLPGMMAAYGTVSKELAGAGYPVPTERYFRKEHKYDPPGTPLGMPKEIHTEESRIFQALMKMTYEDMLNGKMEEL